MNGYYEQDERPVPIAAVIVIGVVAVIASLWLTFSDKNTLHALGDHRWPYIVGTVAGQAVIIVAVAGLVLVPLFRHDGGRGTAVAGIIFAVILVADLGGLVLLDLGIRSPWAADIAQRNVAFAEIDAAKAALMAGRPIDMHIKAKGQFGEMERVSKQMFNTVDTDRRQYKAVLAETGYPGFLMPQQYKADRGLVQTRAKLARVREALALYRRRLASLIDDGRAMVKASQMSELAKTEMITGMERSRSQDAQSNRLLALDDAIFAERAAMLDVLVHAKGRWVVSGNELKFYNASDLAAYRADVAHLQELAAQERAALAAVQADAAALPSLSSH